MNVKHKKEEEKMKENQHSEINRSIATLFYIVLSLESGFRLRNKYRLPKIKFTLL